MILPESRTTRRGRPAQRPNTGLPRPVSARDAACQCEWLGTVWRAPFRLDIGAATQAGANALEIRVVNVWVNRLIGDAQPDAKKVTFTAAPTYAPSAALRPSGLIGPVQLLRVAAAR